MQVVARLEICTMQIYILLYTSDMSNPITVGQFGTLLLLYSLLC